MDSRKLTVKGSVKNVASSNFSKARSSQEQMQMPEFGQSLPKPSVT
jgi:hypothetical protein